MKGRKPIPTAVHELHGNPSRQIHSELEHKRNMEPPARGIEDLIPPEDLNEVQREIWLEAIAYATPGLLRRIDGRALRAWVVACELHQRASYALNQSGLLVRASLDPKNMSQAIPNPLLGIVNRQALIMLRAAEQLGFTPVSRPRIANMQLGAFAAAGTGSRPSARREDDLALTDYLDMAPQNPTMLLGKHVN